MQRQMRRKDRQMDEADAIKLLEANSHGVLATVDEDGAPYAVPVSYVWHRGHIYFHSSSTGQKVENIVRDNRVAFAVVGEVDMERAGPSARFESVIVRGRAVTVTGYDEELDAFYALKRVFMPDTVEDTPASMERLKGKYILYRLEAESISGKARKPQGGGH